MPLRMLFVDNAAAVCYDNIEHTFDIRAGGGAGDFMEVYDKLTILTGAAKYDVACTSSGSSRAGEKGKLGSAVSGGICHSFAADGRCISLLKILMSNYCVYDCKYCPNRVSNDVPRATLTPEELSGLTIAFYKRNYIEGLFLSSGVVNNPDYTMERMIKSLQILRTEHRFNGYIHAKSIPGASAPLIARLGAVADRLSVNIELPSEQSLKTLAPDKDRNSVIRPMRYIKDRITQTKNEIALFNSAPQFAPAGHATQMIIGATPDSDFQIMRLAESLYDKFRLRRVFYSAYVPLGSHELLPSGQPPPLLREHRLYQTDWLLRFYGFTASEILDPEHPSLSLAVDPKCNWALYHLDYFPVEVNTADYETLLRVPGIGVTSAKRIVAARRTATLGYAELKKLGIVLKRAIYFITCSGKYLHGLTLNENAIFQNLVAGSRRETYRLSGGGAARQASFFDDATGVWPSLENNPPQGLPSAEPAPGGAVSIKIESGDQLAAVTGLQLPALEDVRMSATGQM